jgi:hypothetical protein
MEEIEAQVMRMELILKSVIQKIQIKNDGERCDVAHHVNH